MTEPRKQESVAKTTSTKKKVAVVWPSDGFVVEGLPEVTREGVAVTDEQHQQLEKAAKQSGVKLREVND